MYSPVLDRSSPNPRNPNPTPKIYSHSNPTLTLAMEKSLVVDRKIVQQTGLRVSVKVSVKVRVWIRVWIRIRVRFMVRVRDGALVRLKRNQNASLVVTTIRNGVVKHCGSQPTIRLKGECQNEALTEYA